MEENQREGGEEGQDAGQSGTATGRETVAQLLKRVQMRVCEVSVFKEGGRECTLSFVGTRYIAYVCMCDACMMNQIIGASLSEPHTSGTCMYDEPNYI